MKTTAPILESGIWTEVEGDLLTVTSDGTILKITPDYISGLVSLAELYLLSDQGWQFLKRVTCSKSAGEGSDVARPLAQRLQVYAELLYSSERQHSLMSQRN